MTNEITKLYVSTGAVFASDPLHPYSEGPPRAFLTENEGCDFTCAPTDQVSSQQEVKAYHLQSVERKYLFTVGCAAFGFCHLINATREKRSIRFITTLALANLEIVGALLSLSMGWERSMLIACGLTGTTAMIRLCRNYQAPIDDLELSKPYKRISSFTDPLESTQQKTITLTPAQKEKIAKIIDKAHLEPTQVLPSFETLKKQIFSNTLDTDCFGRFLERVTELVQQECSNCHAKNDFSGEPFKITLLKCSGCLEYIYCGDEACKKAFFFHRKSCTSIR